MSSITCLDIQVKLMAHFGIRENLIVPNISSQMGLVPFETDVLVLNKSGYAMGFEIKVSKSDLKADFKKPQHKDIDVYKNSRTGMERYFGKFKHFSYAVPIELKQAALEMIPAFCGLYTVQLTPDKTYMLLIKERDPKFLFKYQWSDKERYEVARLGTMRILGLCHGLQSLIAENKHLKTKIDDTNKRNLD